MQFTTADGSISSILFHLHFSIIIFYYYIFERESSIIRSQCNEIVKGSGTQELEESLLPYSSHNLSSSFICFLAFGLVRHQACFPLTPRNVYQVLFQCLKLLYLKRAFLNCFHNFEFKESLWSTFPLFTVEGFLGDVCD